MKNMNGFLDLEDEQRESTTEWDNLGDAESAFKNDVNAETAEVASEHEVGDDEVYKVVLDDLNRDVHLARVNEAPAEVLKSLTDSRDIFIEASIVNKVGADGEKSEMSLTDALKGRQEVYDQKVEFYSGEGADPERAEENAKFALYADELISRVKNTRKVVEENNRIKQVGSLSSFLD